MPATGVLDADFVLQLDVHRHGFGAPVALFEQAGQGEHRGVVVGREIVRAAHVLQRLLRLPVFVELGQVVVNGRVGGRELLRALEQGERIAIRIGRADPHLRDACADEVLGRHGVGTEQRLERLARFGEALLGKQRGRARAQDALGVPVRGGLGGIVSRSPRTRWRPAPARQSGLRWLQDERTVDPSTLLLLAVGARQPTPQDERAAAS